MQLALRGKSRTWREYTLPAFKALLVISVVEVSGMEQKSELVKKYHAPDSITPPNRRASIRALLLQCRRVSRYKADVSFRQVVL